MSHLCTNESGHTDEWGDHDVLTRVSLIIHEWDIWLTKESLFHEWVTYSHTMMSSPQCPNSQWHSRTCATCHMTQSSEPYICVPWLNHLCAQTHSSMHHDSFIYVPWLHACHDSFTCVPWLIHMCAMTHSDVCHDSFISVPWLIQMCAMIHTYVCHDSFICVLWLIHLCAVTHTYVYHDSFILIPCRLTRITGPSEWGEGGGSRWETKYHFGAAGYKGGERGGRGLFSVGRIGGKIT